MVLKLGEVTLNGEVLDVGLLSSSSICEVVIALRAVPVLEIAVVVASSYCLDVLKLNNCRSLKILAVGYLSKLFVSENELAGSVGAVPVLSTAGNVASLGSGHVSDGVLVGRINFLGLYSTACAGTLFNNGAILENLNGLPSGPVVSLVSGSGAVGVLSRCNYSESRNAENDCNKDCHKLSHCFSPFLYNNESLSGIL